MKRSVSVIAAIVIVMAFFLQRSLKADDMLTLITMYQGTKPIDFKVSRDIIKKQPQWDDESPLPLAFEDAMKIARKSLKEGKGKLLSGEINRIVDPQNVDNDKQWFYIFSFSTASSHFPSDVVVLFDGTLILPSE